MEKKEKLYAGKAKIVYSTDDPTVVIIEYTDQATAFNGAKKEDIADKGLINAAITAHLFELLGENGIPTHYITGKGREIVARKLEMLPVEVVVRNIAAGSMSKRLGIPEGQPLAVPVLEFYLKNDELGDPMINNFHIEAMKLATVEQMSIMEEMSLEINSILREYFARKNIELVDFKLEFGVFQGEVVLGDEISPDTCRFWDKTTGEKLDKDRFRRDMGGVIEAYQTVLGRLQGER